MCRFLVSFFDSFDSCFVVVLWGLDFFVVVMEER